MPFQEVPATVQIRLEGVMDRQQTINNLYFRQITGTISPLTVNTLLVNVKSWWVLNIVPLLSEDFSGVRAQATDLSEELGIVAEVDATSTGGVASESAPNNVAACVSFRTGIRGRSFRGRNYVSGIPNSVITLNSLDPTFVGDLLTPYGELVGPDAIASGWQWVIVSRFSGGLPRGVGITTFVDSVTVVGNFVRSMRSREIGHGS